MAGSYQRATWSHRMRSFQSKQTDINRLIMNYLLREGYKEAAQTFVAQARLESGAQRDSDVYRNAVRASQLQFAMGMAQKLYKRFDSDNYMYFHMQQLQLIELIRNRKLEKLESNPIQLPEDETQSSALLSKELDSTASSKEPMDPRLVFLIKLILWAQSKLDNDNACIDNIRLDFDNHLDVDFECELMHALQYST